MEIVRWSCWKQSRCNIYKEYKKFVSTQLKEGVDLFKKENPQLNIIGEPFSCLRINAIERSKLKVEEVGANQVSNLLRIYFNLCFTDKLI